MTSTSVLQQHIRDEIAALSFSTPPSSLFEPIEYTLELGGKRLRPLLTLMACELFGKQYTQATSVALAIEMFHNFTLLHDDVMDKADIRRGKPTVHKKWNNNVAILSGDAMLIEAYRLIGTLNTPWLHHLLKRFNDTATEVCCGQQMDMDFEEQDTITQAEYLEMIRLKTATLIGFSLEAGGIVAESQETYTRALYNFGIALGLAFQLKDDLLDVYGDTATFGKNIGGDILCNKKTFLLISALEHPSTRKETLYWIKQKEFDAQEKINAVTQIYNRIQLKETITKLIKRYVDDAISFLEPLKQDGIDIQPLTKLTHKLSTREK